VYLYVIDVTTIISDTDTGHKNTTIVKTTNIKSIELDPIKC